MDMPKVSRIKVIRLKDVDISIVAEEIIIELET